MATAGGGSRRPLPSTCAGLKRRLEACLDGVVPAEGPIAVLELVALLLHFLPLSRLSLRPLSPSALSPGPSLLSWSSETGGTTTAPAGVTSTETNVGSLEPSKVTRPM